jgi:hypothetical protein
VLAEKMLQFNLPSAHSVRVPAGEPQGFTCSATKRITVFRTARGRAASVGREEMDVRSRRVSSTHAWMGRWSRRSEIPSSGNVGDWMGTTSSDVVGLAAAVLILAAFFFDFPAAGLVAALDFGLGF